MSGPSVGGGGRGDPFGNIFGGGGGDKQVYPPAPPGYKYVDLNIPQAPEGYSVAKMSSIANNQSTPAPAYGLQGGGGAYGGNAGLYGRGTGARTSYQFNAHSPEGIRERAQADQQAKMMRANQYAELNGLAPPYNIPGMPARAGAAPPAAAPTYHSPILPGATPGTYAGNPAYVPPSSAAPATGPFATGPTGAPSILNPIVSSGATAKTAPPFDPAKGGVLTRSDGTQVLRMPGLDHDIPLKRTASGLTPMYPNAKFTPEGAKERIAFQKYVGGLNLEATTDALNPVTAPPPAVAMPPAGATPPPAVNNAAPAATDKPPAGAPVATPPAGATPSPTESSGPSYVPDVLWKLIQGGYNALTKEPVNQSKALGPQGAIESPYPDLAGDMKYNPLPQYAGADEEEQQDG